VHGDDASSSVTGDLSARQHRPAHRSHCVEPDIVVEIETVDGGDAARLAQQQTKAILDILNWQQTQQMSDRNDEDPPRTVT
jgi:hypothetical protein